MNENILNVLDRLAKMEVRAGRLRPDSQAVAIIRFILFALDSPTF
jgi:hypothetical protein